MEEPEEQALVQDLWLAYREKGGNDERNRLVEHYSPLVKQIAMKIVRNYIYFSYAEDIVSEGLIALVDAVKKYDEGKNVKFETFASIKIRGAMIDYIRRQDYFPRRLKQAARELRQADDTLSQILGKTPNDAEMADYLQVPVENYRKMAAETSAMTLLSFEELLYERDAEQIGEMEHPSSAGNPERSLDDRELLSVLSESIAALPEKEQLVISLYYKEQLKIKEIAAVLDVSSSRVSQIHSRALEKLKKSLSSYCTA